ncbi:MAG: aminomethyl-transferring glycine dehydrogenase subunit GcvPA [Bryobacterales bacterium]|nr:aminomethyl-transferring glycine dehydrogenase subunit GcvPA [Bryobacterales bacterium]
MRYLPKSQSERGEMLAALGLSSAEELFACIPSSLRQEEAIRIPPGLSEYEIRDYFEGRARESSRGFACFLGAGAYHHFRPVVVDAIATRGEFLTAYTPYQAEISQGILTSIFEFQTMVAQLTGMDVANASMYDGSTAVPEAGMMAVRITRRERLLVAQTVHPEYRQVLGTYYRHQDLPVGTIAYDPQAGRVDLEDLESKLSGDIAAVIIQSPNFFGAVENVPEVAELVHRHGALLVVVVSEAASLGLLAPPREADIVAGELQSFAHPPSYGGPFVGILATKTRHIRQIPGRLVGQTVDSQGRRAFCLTLATREQHIRRARATSNICTNQALVALMATVCMTLFGKRGLRELAEQNLAKAHYLADAIRAAGAELPFSGPFFNEFVALPHGRPGSEVNRVALDSGIIGGLEMGDFYPELEGALLVCATETSTRKAMDRYANCFGDAANE